MPILRSKVDTYSFQGASAHDGASGIGRSPVAALRLLKRNADDARDHCASLALGPGPNPHGLAPEGFAVIALTLPDFAGYDRFVTRRTNGQRDAVVREFEHDSIIEVLRFVGRKDLRLYGGVALAA